MDLEKTSTKHAEENLAAEDENDLARLQSRYVDNYHGVHLNTVLVYIALCALAFVQLFNIVGSGAYARNVAAAIGGSDKTVWLSQAIVITTCVLGPPTSQAADYWGRKWFLVVAAIFGFVGALILARANTFNQAIAGEVICSIMYISQAILTAVASEILPRKFRPSAQAGLNLAGGLGAMTGLLAGSALTSGHLYGWRNYWYIVTALMAGCAIIIGVLYNPPPRPLQISLTTSEKLARLDWVAYFLLAAGLTLFTMGLSWGDNPYSWSNVRVLAPLIIGACFIIALVVHQTFLRKDGLVHHDLFKNDRNFAVGVCCLFADGMAFFASNNYYAFQVSVLYETDAMLVGVHFCIAFIAAIVSSASVVLIQMCTKSIREPAVAAFVLFVIFYALMATTDLSSAKAVWGYPVLLGVGLGWSLTYLITAVQLSTPPHMIAVTSGILLAARSFGGSVALAIYTAIFNSSLSSKLGSGIAAAVVPLGFPPAELEQFIGALAANNEAALVKIPGVTPQIIAAGAHALQNAYLASFKGVWIAAAVFSGVTAIGACFLKNPTKDLNNHVDAPLEA